jgi:hypothetical protein
MKKTVLFLLSFLLFFSCEKSDEKAKTDENLYIAMLAQSSRNNNCKNPGDFWARDLTSNIGRSYCVSSRLVGEGTFIKLYLENGIGTSMDYKTIVSEFDVKMRPKSDIAFGPPSDINKDEKISVLILDIRDGAKSGSGFVAGFVDPINFYRDNSSFVTRSNQMELLYMDGVELERLRIKEANLGLPDTFLSTLAHEYQHLVRFQHSEGLDSTWIDEGTSEVASDLTGYGPQVARMECYRGDSKTSCSNGVSGQSLISWTSSLKNYAFAYSFLSYLYSISGDTDAERGEFFRNTVRGFTKDNVLIRANQSENLLRVFAASKRYDKAILTDNVDTMFRYLYGSFLAQSVGYTDLSKVYLGTNVVTNLNPVLEKYPFPPHLEALYKPSPFPKLSATSQFSLTPSQVYRVNGATSGFSGTSSYIIIAKGLEEYIIFHGGMSTSSGTGATAQILDSPKTIETLDVLQTTGIVCPIDHLQKMHRLQLSLYPLQSLLK